ncbi:uncharacterized protein C8Q71DRAFT_763582 [Rhodofomes roseus]|uniref:Uncharacterized protein n=1 Tax=Rhodofomes roseus TaxID=34475 RepID=A0ABQ8KEI3_9APHY|nr:uncharacterized protein C8Q71DRAFT_763582 [Rhodofomes roseus]KAH9835821.1 hypothetical protein C8Q71DRAFT_763582 [Rhodofomes roseus]
MSSFSCFVAGSCTCYRQFSNNTYVAPEEQAVATQIDVVLLLLRVDRLTCLGYSSFCCCTQVTYRMQAGARKRTGAALGYRTDGPTAVRAPAIATLIWLRQMSSCAPMLYTRVHSPASRAEYTQPRLAAALVSPLQYGPNRNVPREVENITVYGMRPCVTRRALPFEPLLMVVWREGPSAILDLEFTPDWPALGMTVGTLTGLCSIRNRF